MSVKVNALDHLVINVADVARSVEWYRNILGMEVRVFDPGHGKPKRTSLVRAIASPDSRDGLTGLISVQAPDAGTNFQTAPPDMVSGPDSRPYVK